jgi:hypothetical protein
MTSTRTLKGREANELYAAEAMGGGAECSYEAAN